MTKKTWKIFKNTKDYETGMSRLLELATSDLEPETNEFDEFELLSLLVEHYEQKEFPMDKPTPIEAIKFRMDQEGLTMADMTEYLGSKSKVSEVLSEKRPLSLSMIRRLHDGLGIPADILIQDLKSLEWSPLVANTSEIAIDLILSNTEHQGDFKDYALALTAQGKTVSSTLPSKRGQRPLSKEMKPVAIRRFGSKAMSHRTTFTSDTSDYKACNDSGFIHLNREMHCGH